MRYGAVLILGMAAAFGGGYLFGVQPQAPSISEDGDSSDVHAVQLDPTENLRDDETSLNGVDAREQKSASPTLQGHEGVSHTLRDLVRSIPHDEIVRGEGEIRGRVRTEAGEPLSGVVITGIPQRSNGLSWRAADVKDPEERVARRIQYSLEQERWRRSHEITTTSTETGEFVLSGATSATHALQAKAEGWMIHGSMQHQVQPGTTIDLIAIRRSSVVFELTSPDGEALDHANISATSPSGGVTGLHWSSMYQTQQLSPGIYDLEIRSGKHQELVGTIKSFEVKHGESNVVRLQLEATPTVLLTLAFAEGEESPCTVLHMPWSEASPPNAAVFLAKATPISPSPMHHLQMGSTRNQTLSGLEKGRLAIGIIRGSHYIPGHTSGVVEGLEVIQVDGGMIEHTLSIPKLAPTRCVVLTIQGPDGQSLPGVRVQAGFKNGSRHQSENSTLCVAHKGRRTLISSLGVPDTKDTTCWISVTSQAYGSKRVEFDRFAGQEIVVSFAGIAKLQVTIDGNKSLDLDSNTMQISVTTGRGTRGHTAKCDEHGHAVVSGLQPGEVTLKVSIGGSRRIGGAANIHSESVTLSTGDNTVRVTLPTLYGVKFQEVEGQVFISSKNRSAHRGTTRFLRATEGEAYARWLPEGTYSVRSGSKMAEFTVPGTSVVVLKQQTRRK